MQSRFDTLKLSYFIPNRKSPHKYFPKLKGRGAKGMIGLQRLFKIMDDDGTQTLSLPEFSKACRDFRIGISDENVPILFSKFDVNNDGTISYDEFLNAVRDPMNDRRLALVEKAF